MSKRCRPLMPIPTEDKEQQALVAWLNMKGLLYTHCPNGGHRAMSEARRLKALGVMPGVPDILIFDPPPYCSAECRQRGACLGCTAMSSERSGKYTRCRNTRLVGTAIEMKRARGGKATLQQESWLSLLRQRGWAAQVCHGAQEAIDWLTALGY